MKSAQWYLSPPLLIVLTATLVLSGLFLFDWLNARRYRLTAQVEIGAPALDRAVLQPQEQTAAKQWPEGEVARTAGRVREATALLMGLTLLAVQEEMNQHRHSQAESLLALLAARHLLPPNLQRVSPTELTSPQSAMVVRFRLASFGLEVVSIGKTSADGPPLIARLTAGEKETANAVLLFAKTENAPIPAPFASLTEVQAAGWSVEPLRESALPSTESEQLRTWAQQYAAAGK